MRATRRSGGFFLLVLAAGALLQPVVAEDVEKKFRLSLSLGSSNGQDEITSDSANILTLVDQDQSLVDRFVDPRNDSAVFGRLDIQSGPLATFAAQYAITKIFIVEASVGYSKADLGDIEIQAQFDGVEIPETQNFNFAIRRVSAGEMERIPIQLTGLVRFRPRASFNPYVGAGFGYMIVGFEPSAELNELSVNMDGSRGGLAELSSDLFGTASLFPAPAGAIRDLQGVTIEAPDTWTWHLAAGAELSFKRKWSLLIDLRYMASSRSATVGLDGGEYLGIAVPQLTDFEDSPAAQETYGAIQITNGGLWDGGSLQPSSSSPQSTDCDTDPQLCEFVVGAFDGELDTGFYYTQGGTVTYDDFSIQLGIRYTF